MNPLSRNPKWMRRLAAAVWILLACGLLTACNLSANATEAAPAAQAPEAQALEAQPPADQPPAAPAEKAQLPAVQAPEAGASTATDTSAPAGEQAEAAADQPNLPPVDSPTPTSERPNLPPAYSPTPTSERPNQPPFDTPTPTAARPAPTQTPGPARTPVLPKDYTFRTARTNAQGRAVFSDPLTGASITLVVLDRTTQKPVRGVKVTFASSAVEFLFLAVDPKDRYAPNMLEVKAADLLRPTPTAPPQNEPSANRPRVEVQMLLVRPNDLGQKIQDWWVLGQTLPDLDRWKLPYQEQCIPNDQLSKKIRNRAGDELLFFPPFEKAFPGTKDDSFASFFSALLDTPQSEQIRAQLKTMNLTLRPAVIRWRFYTLGKGADYLPARPVGWCLEPLDRTDPQSILDWVRYGLEAGETFPFDALTIQDSVTYVNYIEGGQERPTKDFLADLEARLPSQPRCEGYAMYDKTTLQIWTSGWTPKWAMTELCYEGCQPLDPPYQSSRAAFFFYPSDAGYELKVLWLNDAKLWEDVYGVRLAGCDEPYPPQKFLPTPTPIPTSVRQCAGAPTSRLQVGEYAYVSLNPPLANNLRKGPGKNEGLLGQIPPGGVLEVLDGPQCVDGWAWWKVRVRDTGMVGWTAEGDKDNYWLIPCKELAACRP